MIADGSAAPVLVATDILGGLEDPAKQLGFAKDIPAKRLARPQEVAAAITFLASEDARNITGEEIDINGGSHKD